MAGNFVRKDRLYHAAKESGYRSRAAFKLIELDKRFKLFRPGMRVLDLGSFPGGWVQIALERVKSSGKVVGVDLRAVEEVLIKGARAEIFIGDITAADTQGKVLDAIGGKADIVLSDLSPQLTGIKFQDSVRSAELVQTGIEVCEKVLAPGGTFVAKIFPGAEAEEIAKEIRKRWKNFTRCSLDATRKSSNELYFVARNFHASISVDS